MCLGSDIPRENARQTWEIRSAVIKQQITHGAFRQDWGTDLAWERLTPKLGSTPSVNHPSRRCSPTRIYYRMWSPYKWYLLPDIKPVHVFLLMLLINVKVSILCALHSSALDHTPKSQTWLYRFKLKGTSNEQKLLAFTYYTVAC